MTKLPPWLIKKTPKQKHIRDIRDILNDDSIHTVCESAKCPNIGECYAQKSLTFMILGNNCTRHCTFCAVEKGAPTPINTNEPKSIAEAALKLGIKYLVITSVTRDDLPDGGASHFAACIKEVKNTIPDIQVEVLIPDFQGDLSALKTVIEAEPLVINHNVETLPRLYPAIRPQAIYQRSLELLKRIKSIKKSVYTKSGFMVGLGENSTEIEQVLEDLAKAEVDIVTIGQYIPPSKDSAKLVEYINPEVFEKYREIASKMGFRHIAAGPFVRSSYQAWNWQKDS